MIKAHRCKCHGKPYSRCDKCYCEYCQETWCDCPRQSWHPAHAVVVERYETYRFALQLLCANHTTVSQRKSAIIERDQFESDLRAGKFNGVFDYPIVRAETCFQCGDGLDSNPGVTETGEPVCSESCYRAWIAHLEAQA